jgi:hypothetical protein
MAIKDLVISSANLLEDTVEKVVQEHFKYSDIGEILIVNKKFWELKGEERILRYLAAIAGRQFLDINTPEISLNNFDLSKNLNINYNSVRAHLSQLRSRGLIKTEKNKNSISTQGLHELLEKMEEK